MEMMLFFIFLSGLALLKAVLSSLWSPWSIGLPMEVLVRLDSWSHTARKPQMIIRHTTTCIDLCVLLMKMPTSARRWKDK